MSGTIELLCWAIHTPIKQIFAVRVGHDDIWNNVKDVIKEKKPEFDDIALWQEESQREYESYHHSSSSLERAH
jgi:hypothetical protein